MDRQTIEFITVKKDNAVIQTGRAFVDHPEIKFSGGSIKWHEDKLKSDDKPRIEIA